MNNINKEEKMTYDIDCLNITRRAYEEYIKNKTNPDNTITERKFICSYIIKNIYKINVDVNI